MVKKVLLTIKKLVIEFFTMDGPFDDYELCGWQKCPVPEKKEKIEEDYSI